MSFGISAQSVGAVPVSRAQPRVSLQVMAGIVVSLLFFVAENYMPADVVNGSSEDLQVSKLQGSLVRQLAYPMIAGIGVWMMRTRIRTLDRHSPVLIALGMLVAWCGLSMVWSQQPDVSLKRLIAYTLAMTGALGMVLAWTHTAVLRFIALSAAAQLTIGILAEMAFGFFTPWHADYRFAGTLHWNEQGFCCLVLVISALAASDADPRRRTLFRLLMLYGFVFLLLTKSRSSLLGVVVGLLLYVFITRPLYTRITLLLVTSTTALLVYMSGLWDTALTLLSRNGEGAESLTGRIPLWQEILTYVHQRPWTGYGYEDFWTPANVDYFSSEFHWSISAAHNGYLEALLTIGGVGLALQIAVLTTMIGRGVRQFATLRSPVFALAAALAVVFLIVGTLEAMVVVKLSPSSFYLALLLWTLAATPRMDRPVHLA